jgi:hypothetical protein
MKSLIASILALFLLTLPLSAQYETTMFLYDTISEGPYIAPEKGGYNFIFKTRNMGTMVSTRGQVINPAIPYDMFNHYHIQADGQVDSIFAIPVRSEVNHHYTMYQRGAPKLLQFRVGTSNDYPISKIASKYPVLNDVYGNDESMSLARVSIDPENNYKYTNTTYRQGKVNEEVKKTIITNTSEVGSWTHKGSFSNAHSKNPLSIVIYGKVIPDNRDLKDNDLHEFKFTSLSEEGLIIHEEEISFERAYVYHNSGIIHSIDGSLYGYYISLVEADGKANKDYNSANQKIIYFDKDGQYVSETLITLPFEPKTKEVENQQIVKIVKVGNDYNIFVSTPGSKKSKIKEGIYTFIDYGETAEEVAYKAVEEINIEQILRNQPSEEVQEKANQNFNYAEKLENGDLLLVSSDNGRDIQFLQLDSKGNLKYTSKSYLLCDVQNASSQLSFEHLQDNKLLIVSKVAKEKSVKTSYSIYDGRYGRLETVQPTGDLGSIYSYRNGNEILVFGSSKDDINTLFFKLVKLEKGEDSVTTIGRK